MHKPLVVMRVAYWRPLTPRSYTAALQKKKNAARMNSPIASLPADARAQPITGWRELWLKEDWWAVWLGLGLVAAAYVLFLNGYAIKWIAVTPAKWSTAAQIGEHFRANSIRYVAQFLLWLAIFSIALSALGYRAREFVPGFALLYVLSIAIFTLGQWTQASHYNLEPPLVALALGLLISNGVGLPRWLDAAFRVEFFIKIGIVLLGATLPFTLIVWAGPVAILQASIVSLVTFAVIFLVGCRLGLGPRFAAVLGVGGAVCGVSAAIAVSAAVGARKQEASVAIATVILWAIVMIFVLPFAARALGLAAGVGGAWIGTSEFADAAGLAAAESYGRMAVSAGLPGTADQATFAFTLMKVVGRDVWIGIWAFVLAVVATTRWERSHNADQPRAAQIWWRFPKFVIGFLVASLLVTVATSHSSFSDYNQHVAPSLVAPLKDLRTWAFIFCFLSIGLTTRVRELAYAGARPLLAFTAGVVVNVALGYWLSVHVFANHWANIAH
jgi:uncharacterized integral membrane protein (TIGR00698 family)